MNLSALTKIEDWVSLRKKLWQGDIKRDTAFIKRAASCIVASPAMRREVAAKPWLLVQALMQVVDKKKRLVPFFLNEVQQDFVDKLDHRQTGRPIFVLKGRQQGFTTLITAIQLCYCLTSRNFAGFTLADTTQNMNAIFADKAKALYDRLPPAVKPRTRYNSRKEMVFEGVNSSWRVGVAGENLGRSRTLHFVHYSEVAFYRCSLSSLQRSLGEAVTADAIVVYETTAAGLGEAKELWDSGVCENLFYPWWRTAEYRLQDAPCTDANMDAWLQNRVTWLQNAHLDPCQIAWYVAKYAGYLDKHSIRQEYPCFPAEAWQSGADCYFDRDKVLAAIALCDPAQDRVGYFACRKVVDEGEHIVVEGWVDDPNGCIRLHTPPQTKRLAGQTLLHPYALGGDTAGEGSDYYTAKVVSAISAKTVATLRIAHTDDDLYAMQIYALASYYNHAVVAIETNFSLMPTRLLERWGYAPLYRREKWDSAVGGVEQRAGFCTNAVTRPVILANLKSIWRVQENLEPDRATLDEMLCFVRTETGRPQAAGGKHDDLVMALAIAHHAAGQGREWVVQSHPDSDWIGDNFHVSGHGNDVANDASLW